MTRDELNVVFEVIQTHKFMMASAFSGSVPNNREMKAYMGKIHRLQEAVKAEIDGFEPDAKQLQLPIKHDAATEFSMNWAKYRDGQRSMLSGIVCYLDNTGHPGIANRIKEKFNGVNG